MANRVKDSMRRGLEQATAHAKGQGSGVRSHRAEPMDVKAIREKVGLTQEPFSARLGISLETPRHWERGNLQPRGTARALLTVISGSPKAVMRAIDGRQRARRQRSQRHRDL